MATSTVPFEPPGPGRWALDRSHFTGAATPIVQWLIEEGTADEDALYVTGGSGGGIQRFNTAIDRYSPGDLTPNRG